MKAKISIGLFDDHPLYMDGATRLIEKNQEPYSLAFTASSKEELLQALSINSPDILVMDVLAPDVSGLDLFTEVLKINANLRIIANTTLKSEILIESLLDLGVKGYVSKNQDPKDLFAAIEEVYYDLISVPDGYKHLIAARQIRSKRVFTPRELDIIKQMASGATSTQIADALKISLRTVENIKANLFLNFEVKNAAELVLVATRLGYLS